MSAAIVALWSLISGYKTYAGALGLIFTGLAQVVHFLWVGVGSPLEGILIALLGWVIVGLRHVAGKILRALAGLVDPQNPVSQ